MVVTVVSIRVKPEHIDEFIKATISNHEGSVREPGNLRFDFLQSEEDPARFVLYEAYQSGEAAARHKETAHYLAWRDAATGWMAEPRTGVKYRGIRP